MNTFQWIIVPLLTLILLREFVGFFRHRTNRVPRMIRCAIWGMAIATIVNPDIPQTLAIWVGITRGADLVFYVFVLVSIGASFMFYANQVRLHRQLTDLVRHLAILEAKRGRSIESS